MKALRLLAIVLGLALMLGEGYRSWGFSRPVFAWIDDVLLGCMLIGSAALLRRETAARRAFFSGAWGIGVGGLYGSFFSKLADPHYADAGNVAPTTLTLVLGVAFAVAIACFIASILLPFKPSAL